MSNEPALSGNAVPRLDDGAKRLLEALPTPAWLWDCGTEAVTWANAAGRALWAGPVELGAAAKRRLAAFRRRAERGEAFVADWPARFGPVGRPLQCALSPVATDPGGVGLLAVVSGTGDRYLGAIDASDKWVWEMDADLRFTYFSANVERIVGVPAPWHYGKSREDIGRPEGMGAAWDAHLADLKARRPFKDFIYKRVGPTADQWMRTSGVPVFDASGEFLGYRGMAEDITVQIEAQERADAAQEHLRALNAELESRVAQRTATIAENNARLDALNRELMTLIDSSPVSIVLFDHEGCVLRWNDAAERIFGYTETEVIGRTPASIPEAERAAFAAAFARCMTGVAVNNQRGRRLTKSGRWIDIEFSLAPLTDETGRPCGAVSIAADVTERVSVDRQLRQAQKMEAIGQLTGGLAHDFNNWLSVIIGNLDLVARYVDDSRALALLNAAQSAGKQGAALTQHLLAFSRGHALNSAALDVNEVLSKLRGLLQSTIGANIEIRLQLGDDVGQIATDRTQLETAIINLCVNARDAMPDGGTLTIATGNRELDAHYAASHPGVDPGDYLELVISDTGIGMPPDMVGRIFEPFFTTKELGQGTGLGLAMVFGFVRQSKGHIMVYSEPGHGTSFRLLFPRVAGAAEQASTEKSDVGKTPRGKETILVVEDNELLREVAVRQLQHLGYTTLTADNGVRAIQVLESDAAIDLLMSDVVMPGGVSGYELAKRARVLRPGLRVLLASGNVDLLNSRPDVDGTLPVLAKPFRQAELANAIRALLDA